MSTAATIAPLLDLPGVRSAVDEAREACTGLRWHQALRRRIPEAAAESRVRGAWSSGELDGARFSVDTVRDLMRGSVTWHDRVDPVERTLKGAIAATAETERVARTVRSAPLHALARLHTAAAAGLLDEGELGRPRQDGEDCREFVDLDPPPPAGEIAARLSGIAGLIESLDSSPAPLVLALVHAEIVTVRPFVRGNGLVARALERALMQGSGLDPTGVAVPEAGHGSAGGPAYLGALTGYGLGTTEGVALWLRHAGQAYVAAAAEGTRIANAVLAGRLT